MAVLFLAGLAAVYAAERAGNPLLAAAPIDAAHGVDGGQGGPLRRRQLGALGGATTAASNGSVNAMHDSFTPLGGLVLMLNMQLGEIVFGGVGAGFYGMLLFVVLTVFMAGLMVGRTPEYLGKKIEARRSSSRSWRCSSMPVGILIFGGARGGPAECGSASVQDQGPHGLSEILYAYSSATANNGSAFARLRRQYAVPQHACRASRCCSGATRSSCRCSRSPAASAPSGRFRPRPGRSRPTARCSSTLLVAVILIVGGLTFFPALALGPLAEHFAMPPASLF